MSGHRYFLSSMSFFFFFFFFFFGYCSLNRNAGGAFRILWRESIGTLKPFILYLWLSVGSEFRVCIIAELRKPWRIFKRIFNCCKYIEESLQNFYLPPSHPGVFTVRISLGRGRRCANWNLRRNGQISGVCLPGVNLHNWDRRAPVIFSSKEKMYQIFFRITLEFWFSK